MGDEWRGALEDGKDGATNGAELSAIDILKADVQANGEDHGRDDDPPAAMKSDNSSDGDEDVVLKKRPCDTTGGKGRGTTRRQIVEVSSDSDDDMGLDLNVLDICNISSEHSDSGKDSDEDSSDQEGTVGNRMGDNHSSSAAACKPTASAWKPTLESLGDLTIPPFRGGAARAAGGGASERRGDPTEIVNLALDSNSSDSDDDDGFIPFRKPSASSESSSKFYSVGGGQQLKDAQVPTSTSFTGRLGKKRGKKECKLGWAALSQNPEDEEGEEAIPLDDNPPSQGRKTAAPDNRKRKRERENPPPSQGGKPAASEASGNQKGKKNKKGKSPSQEEKPVPPGKKQKKNKKGKLPSQEKKLEILDSLWPSPSRFFRAVLRWIYLPKDLSLKEDSQFAKRMADLTTVPTEFATVLEYQKIMSQLVMKEALSSLQQDLAVRKSERKFVRIEGEVLAARLVEVATANGSSPPSSSSPSSSSSSSSSDIALYSVKVELNLPRAPPRSSGRFGKDGVPLLPLWGNELVGLSSPRWGLDPEKAFSAVVLSWDPVYKSPGVQPTGNMVRLLVCASSTGGDGVGGRGGWMPLKQLQAWAGKEDRVGFPITVSGGVSLSTSLREFQAVMSLSGLPESVRRFLLNPKVIQQSRAATARQAAAPLPTLGNRNVRGGGSGNPSGLGQQGGVCAQEEEPTPPPNVPIELWKCLLQSYNRSQTQAIRAVMEGSPSGFTLLQGPPGTGKTRTILGLVGAMLAGGCPFPAGHGTEGGQGSRKLGAKVIVGSSVTGATAGGSRKKGVKIPNPLQRTSAKILVTAPSNAAVDELVVRLRQDGVPGKDGGVHFPKVVRVGGPLGSADTEADGGGRRRGRDGGPLRSPIVEEVMLDRLVDWIKTSSAPATKSQRLSVLLEAEVVCATLSGSGSKHVIEAVMPKKSGCSKTVLHFDAVIMDEAAQAVEPSSLIPLKFNPRAVVLVGDPAQLPATIFSQAAKKANYDQSLFQRLQRGGHPKMMLDMQYRMHREIASFASSRFYDGLLSSAPTVTRYSHGQVYHRLHRFSPYLFHNVSGGRLRREGSGSMSNPIEVGYIASMLRDLVTTFPDVDFNGKVGVIAPYRGQIDALRRGLWATRLGGVEISTVDGFQGREKEIMIFSCVRAPEEGAAPGDCRAGGVGFLDDWRRLNVAITRAKFAMWIVGHSGVLKQSEEWRELINDSKKRNAYMDSDAHRDPPPSGRGSSSSSRGSGNGNGNGNNKDNGSRSGRNDSDLSGGDVCGGAQAKNPAAESKPLGSSRLMDQGQEERQHSRSFLDGYRGEDGARMGGGGQCAHGSSADSSTWVPLPLPPPGAGAGAGAASNASTPAAAPLNMPPPLSPHVWASGTYYARPPVPPMGQQHDGSTPGGADNRRPNTLVIAQRPNTLMVAPRPNSLMVAQRPNSLMVAQRPNRLMVAQRPDNFMGGQHPNRLVGSQSMVQSSPTYGAAGSGASRSRPFSQGTDYSRRLGGRQQGGGGGRVRGNDYTNRMRGSR